MFIITDLLEVQYFIFSDHMNNATTPTFLNINEIEQIVCRHLLKKDLFDQLVEQNQSNLPSQFNPPSKMEDIESIESTQQEDEPHSFEIPKSAHAGSRQAYASTGCKCSKIGCLKLYCQCFSKGKICSSLCCCVGCENKIGNEAGIYQAKQNANYRQPNYFPGIPSFVPIRKCTCKKSECRKNYCECYSAGVKCTSECQCLNCHNQRPHDHDHYDEISHLEIEVYG